MRKKYQVFSVGIICLFIGLAIGPVTAQKLSEKIIQDDTICVEYALIDPDGSILKETTYLSEQELVELQITLTNLIEILQSKTNYNDIINAVYSYIAKCDNPVLSRISKWNPPEWMKPFIRSFVVSHGWGFKFNPLKFSEVKIFKPFVFWHYSLITDQSGIILPSKTLMVSHLPFKVKTLNGMQLGWMTNFIGLYIYVARQLPLRSYMFFIGSARYAGGFDFSPFQ